MQVPLQQAKNHRASPDGDTLASTARLRLHRPPAADLPAPHAATLSAPGDTRAANLPLSRWAGHRFAILHQELAVWM